MNIQYDLPPTQMPFRRFCLCVVRCVCTQRTFHICFSSSSVASDCRQKLRIRSRKRHTNTQHTHNSIQQQQQTRNHFINIYIIIRNWINNIPFFFSALLLLLVNVCVCVCVQMIRHMKKVHRHFLGIWHLLSIWPHIRRIYYCCLASP